ncbi:MAG: SDR family oxidoreductase [Pseudomonadota bacterium]
MKDLFSLDGRIALVTGGSRGIGKMIAEGFLHYGAEKVFIVARKKEACEETAKDLSALGACIPFTADLSTVEGCVALASTLANETDQLDILVNNAGAAWGAPFETFPEDGWDKVMNLNLKTPFYLAQQLAPMLKKAARADRPAKLINIASVDGIKINAWETYPYQASKAGVIQLTRRLSAKLIADHICVSAIAPGAFPSEMNIAARDATEAVGNSIPAGRVGSAEDMAGATVYLASRAGDYVVGDTLVVDGGYVHGSIGQAWG